MNNLPPGMTHAPGDTLEDNLWLEYWGSDRPKQVYIDYFLTPSWNEHIDRMGIDFYKKYERLSFYPEEIDKDFENWKEGKRGKSDEQEGI